MPVWLETWLFNLYTTAKLLLMIWAAWGLGNFILRLFKPGKTSRLENFVISVGLGTGALSLIILSMGAAGLYRPVFFNLLLGIMFVIGLIVVLRPDPSIEGKSGFASWRGWNRVITILLGAGILITWIISLSPPIFYDALVYHLGVPNLFLLRGGVEYLPSVVYSNFPLGTEMINLLGIHAGGNQLAVLVNFGYGVLAAAAVASFAGRQWGEDKALLSAAFFYLTPMVFLISRYCLVESALAFYFMLVVMCLYRWRDEPALNWASLAGVFGGLSLSTKYPGGLYGILIPSLVLIPGSLRGRKSNGSLKYLSSAAVFFTAAALTAMPWLVKNGLFTGNPFHPAFYPVLGGSNWSVEQAGLLDMDAHAVWAISTGWKDFLRLPWDLVSGGGELGAGSAASLFWPMVLGCALVLVFQSKTWKEKRMLILLVIYGAVWASTFWMARFLLPAMGLGAVMIALVLTGLKRRFAVVGPASVLVVVFAFNAVFLWGGAMTRQAFLPALGFQEKDAYLTGKLRMYSAAMLINRHLPHDARILVLGDSKVAYLRRDHIYNSVMDEPLVKRVMGENAGLDQIEAGLAGLGITHVLINVKGLKQLERAYPVSALGPELMARLSRFLDKRCRLIYSGNSVYLYERAPPPAEIRGRGGP